MNSRGSIAFVCALLTASLAPAQVNTAAVLGTVVDSSQGAIAGAKITITNIATEAQDHAVSGADGSFLLNPLVPGEYVLTIDAPGFESLRQSAIRLSAGQRLRATYPLHPAAVQQTIDVSGQAPLVNTDNAEQRTTISQREVDRLPLARRDWTAVTTLGTGIQFNSDPAPPTLNGLPPARSPFPPLH